MNYLEPAPSCIYHQGGLSYEAQPSVLTGYQLTRPGPGAQSPAPAESRDQASVGDETGAGTELSLVFTQQLIDIHVSKLRSLGNRKLSCREIGHSENGLGDSIAQIYCVKI